MKVSIDPVETFFSSVTSVWGKMLAFLGTCWISFAFTVFCIGPTWSWNDGFAPLDGFGKFLVTSPAIWLWSLFEIVQESPWGILFIIFLAGALYAILFIETNLLRTAALVFIVQGWHTCLWRWLRDRPSFSWDLYGDWHFLLPFMVLLHPYVLWRLYSSWRDERRAEMPP